MNLHTFYGKRKVGSTDVLNFTDFQGIGQDPMYKRYDSVNSILRRIIKPEYIHFLAVPNYNKEEDVIDWFIDEWKEAPRPLKSLEGEERAKYEKIKDETVEYYRNSLNDVEGEDLQIMMGALRYISDDFIYCSDGKVYLLAWGMTPDKTKAIVIEELVHGAPNTITHKVTFRAGDNGTLEVPRMAVQTFKEGAIIKSSDIPKVQAAEGYIFKGWDYDPSGWKVENDMTFNAVYEKTDVPPAAPPVPPVPEPPMPETPETANVFFYGSEGLNIVGNTVLNVPKGTVLTKADIPRADAEKGYKFTGWTPNPEGYAVNEDTYFTAQSKKHLPWYKRFWAWLMDNKWLLWLLLFLLLLLLFALLFRRCASDRFGCTDRYVDIDSEYVGHGDIGIDIDSVEEHTRVRPNDLFFIDEEGHRIVDPGSGREIEYNGGIRPIILDDGRLPEEGWVVPPMFGDDGRPAPITTPTPDMPSIVSNRLILFLEDDNDDIDALARDFKKVYPGEQYPILGYDKEVKSLVIGVPEAERDRIRESLNEQIPNHRFLVFDDEIYELNGQEGGDPENPGWHLKAVHARQGWEITEGKPDVVVAIVDDGIESSHPMFKGRIVDPYNVFTQNNRLSFGSGHGTHVAALAVGSTQFLSKGAAGIAPKCSLMPIQVFDNQYCPTSALISGIMYAVHKDADVVNISIAPSFQGLNSLPVQEQIEIAKTQFKNMEKLWDRVCRIAAKKNTILVFAAGNDDIISWVIPENRTDVAISVGAVNAKLQPTQFTNYGEGTDISAPGDDIFSAFPRGTFKRMDGTSMAAPIVTGTIALMKSLKKDITLEQVRNVLYRTGRPIESGSMPPMILVDHALKAVKAGDFSAPDINTNRSEPAPIANDQTPNYDDLLQQIEEHRKAIEKLNRQLPPDRRVKI